MREIIDDVRNRKRTVLVKLSYSAQSDALARRSRIEKDFDQTFTNEGINADVMEAITPFKAWVWRNRESRPEIDLARYPETAED